MTTPSSEYKTALMAAAAYAGVYAVYAKQTARGQDLTEQLALATAQLRAALDIVDGFNGEPSSNAVCKCGHDHFDHEGTTGGVCLVGPCECRMFEASEGQ